MVMMIDGKWYSETELRAYVKELEQKAADVQPVKLGTWECSEYLFETGQTRCSYCKTTNYVSDLEVVSLEGGLPEYCPVCGAKMKNGGNENDRS